MLGTKVLKIPLAYRSRSFWFRKNGNKKGCLESDQGPTCCRRYGSFNEVIRRPQQSFYEFNGEMLRNLTDVTRWGPRFEEQWMMERFPRVRIHRFETEDPVSDESGYEQTTDNVNEMF